MRVFSVLISCALVFLAPLAGAPARLLHPSPWLGFVAFAIILLSQPALPAGRMFTDAKDRGTALGIYVAQGLSPLAAILQFGYRTEFHPTAVSLAVGVGLAAIVGGLGLRLWAIRTLGRFFTSTVMVQSGQTVVEAGPYRVLRHPSYTGALVTTLGVTITLASPLGVALCLLLGIPAYLYRISVEEAALTAQLGEPYRSYRTRTSRLIPWIY